MAQESIHDSPYGSLVATIDGQSAFVPDPLPRQLDLNSELVFQLDVASRAVANLAGVGETVQNPHLLIRPFVRREAVLSSRIEGTEASLSDLLLFEAGGDRLPRRRFPGDVEEVVNYVHALEYGIDRIEKLPLSVRLINEVHSRLLQGVRGVEMRPGELRTRQVWIGPPGTPIQGARFIPPPAGLILELLGDWERFVNEDSVMPPLIKCALMHYQIEAIHPYLDGNGRTGRLLISLFLHERGLLRTPLLYLSAYFERDRQRYYDELLRVSVTCDWDGWLSYFLSGVAEQAQDALIRVRRLRAVQARYRETLLERHESSNALRLLDQLFAYPFMAVSNVADLLDISHSGARRILDRLVEASIVEYLPDTWPRIYCAIELLNEIESPVSGGS